MSAECREFDNMERCCVYGLSARVGVDATRWFNVALFTPGPYTGVLKRKAEGKPYTLQRFRIYGEVSVEAVNPPPIVGYIDWVRVLYLGRKGDEHVLKFEACGKARCTTPVDSHIDVKTEFRGLGVQALRVEGAAGWWFDVDIHVSSLCLELTWVG